MKACCYISPLWPDPAYVEPTTLLSSPPDLLNSGLSLLVFVFKLLQIILNYNEFLHWVFLSSNKKITPPHEVVSFL